MDRKKQLRKRYTDMVSLAKKRRWKNLINLKERERERGRRNEKEEMVGVRSVVLRMWVVGGKGGFVGKVGL